MAILPVGIGPQEGGYQIERSLRFNSADSAYMSRTPASAGSLTTWTWSGWFKRSALGARQTFFSGGPGGSDTAFTQIVIWDDDKLRVGGWATNWRITTQVFRDVSAWMHLVVVWDTGNGTAADKVRVYLNGSRVTAFDTSNSPTNSGINQAAAHAIGRDNSDSTKYFSGYQSEVNFIDGQALDPTSFGEYNSETGVWQPIAYAGTYGTNGFYLNFSDNSAATSTTLGKDYSGNSNNWTPNNFSVTAGAGNDSLVDTPTPYGTDTGAGGEVRGNYATLNPLTAWRTTKPVNGNLEFSSGSNVFALGTMPLYAGKWYCEVKILGGVNEHNVGFVNLNSALTSSFPSTTTIRGSNAFALYSFDGKFYNNGTASASLATFAANDIIMLAYDADNSKIYVGRNGTWLNSAVPASGTGAVSTTATAPLVVAAQSDAGDATGQQWNFGQRPFAYTAPSGFKALCTQNLPEPTVVDGGEYFNTVLYTGTGADQSITSLDFQPDLVWAKVRNTTGNHSLYDSVRGATKRLSSSTTAAEATFTNSLTSFNSNGFSLGSNPDGDVNASGNTYVAWNWKAGGTGVSNTDGTITGTVTVSANTTAGFSIVTYTGNNTSGATVGHGLGVAPAMVICKNRTTGIGSGAWPVWHKSLSGGNYYLFLNTTAAQANGNNNFTSAPTSTVVNLGTSDTNNTADMVMYAFAPVEGYSAFGSYTGNGSTDGVFVYTGFRPRWIMVKRTDTTADWVLYDTERNTYNVATLALYPNLSNAEGTVNPSMDILSNGVKFRNLTSTFNASGGTYIYAAFAENPFKYSLAR